MKGYMNTHVEAERHSMFERSTGEVKERLTTMVRSVEETMLNEADEVFMQIRRDYLAVLGGTEAAQGEHMPKWQRTMRQEVLDVISGSEKVFKKIVGIEDEENDKEDREEEIPDDDVKKQDEDAGTKVEQDVKIKPEKGEDNRGSSALRGSPELAKSDLEQQNESHHDHDEIKPEKEDENHHNTALGFHSTGITIPTLEHHNESPHTQDLPMADSPSTTPASPPTTTSTTTLPPTDAPNSLSNPTTAQPTPNPPPPAASPPAPLPSLPTPILPPHTSTDASNLKQEPRAEERALPPTPDLATQQLQHEILGHGSGLPPTATGADDGSNAAWVGYRSESADEGDAESDG